MTVKDKASIKGRVSWEMFDEHGELKSAGHVDNLVTAVGDQYYAARAALSTGLPSQVTGFRLGTGTTAAAKTGAGAAIVTYISGSNKANDSGFPTATGGVVTFKRTYAPGEATTASEIREVVLNTDTIANDNSTTATAANTISRAVLPTAASGGPGVKNAGDTLVLTWTQTLLGA